MSAVLIDLENILNEEQKIFNNIYQLEEEKSEAIIARDGNLLQSLSSSQEEKLRSIQPLEKKRTEIIDHFRNSHGYDLSQHVTLKDIISTESTQNDKIIKLGAKLNLTLQKMKSLQDTNTKLMNDNIEFFNILLRELKGSVTLKTGYSEKGIEKEEVTNSLILNKTV